MVPGWRRGSEASGRRIPRCRRPHPARATRIRPSDAVPCGHAPPPSATGLLPASRFPGQRAAAAPLLDATTAMPALTNARLNLTACDSAKRKPALRGPVFRGRGTRGGLPDLAANDDAVGTRRHGDAGVGLVDAIELRSDLVGGIA